MQRVACGRDGVDTRASVPDVPPVRQGDAQVTRELLVDDFDVFARLADRSKRRLLQITATVGTKSFVSSKSVLLASSLTCQVS